MVGLLSGLFNVTVCVVFPIAIFLIILTRSNNAKTEPSKWYKRYYVRFRWLYLYSHRCILSKPFLHSFFFNG